MPEITYEKVSDTVIRQTTPQPPLIEDFTLEQLYTQKQSKIDVISAIENDIIQITAAKNQEKEAVLAQIEAIEASIQKALDLDVIPESEVQETE